jgi:hypothetical protein
MKLVNILIGLFVLLFTPVFVSAQSTAFGIDASNYPIITFASVPLPNATPITAIGATAAGGQGGDFGPNSVFYGRSGDDLVTISLTDGSVSNVGTITGISADQIIIGMGFDMATGTMYLATSDLSSTGSELYTLDLSTAAASRVGAITNATRVLAIAVSPAGDIFAFDSGSGNLVSVDPGTGAGTVVGPLTIPYVAQDADFDGATGTLYWTYFDAGSGGRLATVDVSTGVATPVTTWSADFIAFAILGESPPTSVDEQAGAGPSQISLAQNYPNPFNPTTTIRFDLAKQEEVALSIYNLTGQLVRNLVKESLPAGTHSILWDGRDNRARPVPSGLYISRLTAGDYVGQRKMLLIK